MDKAGKSDTGSISSAQAYRVSIVGVPVGDLQDQLGHASLATTGVYLKAGPNHRRNVCRPLFIHYHR